MAPAHHEQQARQPEGRRAPTMLRRGLESVQIALESLRANKLRTLLTMLGIIIGVWSVVSLMAIGNGAQQTITGQFQSAGTNLLTVQSGGARRRTPLQAASVAQPSGPALPLTMDDAEALAAAVPELERVAPSFQGSVQVIASGLNRNMQVVGVTPEYALVRNLTVAQGQFITDQMLRAGRPVVVLGGGLAAELYGDSDPIGESIRLNGQTFKVIGVLKLVGSFGGSDNALLVPITTAYRSLFSGRNVATTSRQVSSIAVQVRSPEEIDLAQLKIENVMRRQHRLPDNGFRDDFSVQNQATLLESLTVVTTTLTVFLGAIAGISLLVGGIGVMNIMLVSVTERTKEIGLRKAVGAKRRNILQQFLVEALLVSLFGGLIGLAIAYATATIIGIVFAEYLIPVVTLSSVLLALGFSAAVGLFFGIYPAQRAARLNPIEALRSE